MKAWVTILGLFAVAIVAMVAGARAQEGRNLNFTAGGKAIIGGVTHAMLTDLASGKRIHQFGPFNDNFHAADVSPDGKYLVTGHLGSHVRIWEIETGTFYRRLGKNVSRADPAAPGSKMDHG